MSIYYRLPVVKKCLEKRLYFTSENINIYNFLELPSKFSEKFFFTYFLFQIHSNPYPLNCQNLLNLMKIFCRNSEAKIKTNWYQTLLPFPSLFLKYWRLRLKDFYLFLPSGNCLKSVDWLVICYKYIYYKWPIKNLRFNYAANPNIHTVSGRALEFI